MSYLTGNLYAAGRAAICDVLVVLGICPFFPLLPALRYGTVMAAIVLTLDLNIQIQNIFYYHYIYQYNNTIVVRWRDGEMARCITNYM